MMPEESRLRRNSSTTSQRSSQDGDKLNKRENLNNEPTHFPEMVFHQDFESITSMIHDATLNFSEEDKVSVFTNNMHTFLKEIRLADEERGNGDASISNLSQANLNTLTGHCKIRGAQAYQTVGRLRQNSSEAKESVTVPSNMAQLRNKEAQSKIHYSSKAQNVGRKSENLFSGSFLISKPESSFALFGPREEFLVQNVEDFIGNLGCEADSKLKVVTIFKDDGDGLADALNRTFFFGVEIFRPCPAGGVWAAYNQDLRAIILMVEGMQRNPINDHHNSLMLLKITAASDVLIFHTRSEILHMNSAELLGELSGNFMERHGEDLDALRSRLKIKKSEVRTLCPGLVIVHETPLVAMDNRHLNKKYVERIENRIREKAGTPSTAYSSISYLCRPAEESSSYNHVWDEVEKILCDNTYRSPRTPFYIFKALRLISFFGSLKQRETSVFLDEFFTCRIQCEVCRSKCTETSNHKKMHCSDAPCKKSQKHSNTVMYCKTCYEKNDEKVKVIPKMPPSDLGFFVSLTKMSWSGFVLDCKNCGQIYKSQKYWYGNQGPEEETVTEHQHVWPDGERVVQDDGYTGRRLIEQISQIGEVLANVSAAPIEAVGVWAADKTAPSYWESNDKPNCSRCAKLFEYRNNRHHCRKCGRCVCQMCSSNKKPVPEMGWGNNPVRVCDDCFANLLPGPIAAELECKTEVTGSQLYPRKVSEYFTSTWDALSCAIKYPLDAIKEGVRPAYWVKDELVHDCCYCKRPFNTPVERLTDCSSADSLRVVLKVHHCRGCGHGVCDDCSRYRPVESRGWETPVRVCMRCNQREDL